MRNKQIDILKGLAIILMVLGHCAPSTHFIYLFHMPLFLISGGFCFQEKYSQSKENYISFLKRKVKTIWFPYVIWNVIFLILNNLFVRINVYGTEKILSKEQISDSILQCFLFRCETQMGGALWFLVMYFWVNIIYGTINMVLYQFKVSRKYCHSLQTVISLVFLYLGYNCSINGICYSQYMHIVLSCYFLFHLGVLFKNIKFECSIGLKATSVIFAYVMLKYCNNMGSIAINVNQYENPCFLLTTSVLGWIMVYGVSYYIEKTKILNKLLCIVGRNTMPIMSLHFLCFKLGNLIFVLMEKKPISFIKIFPVASSEKYWFVLFTLLGVTLPIGANILYQKVVQQCKKIQCLQK